MAHYFFEESTDTKLIILLIAANFKRPVTISDITDLALEHGYADYFPLAQSLSELADSGLLHPAVEDGAYVITESGREALKLFENQIPYSVRRSLCNSVKDTQVTEQESQSVIATYKRENDVLFTFFGEITEHGVPALSLSLSLPSEDSARAAVRSFKKDAGAIYNSIIHSLTENEK